MSAVIRQPGARVGIFTLLARAEGRNCHVRCACGRESVKNCSNAKRLRRCGPECPLPTLYTTHGKRPVTRHIGHRFGRLVVLAIIKSGTDASARVACDCGEVLAVLVSNIASGATTSCGCAAREIAALCAAERATTHGYSALVEYHIWNGMRQRCGNPAVAEWANYGGRGIGVCERWQSFENFFADMGQRPSPDHSIDRIDNDAGYSPENCRWATQREQMRNTRRTRFIVVDGARVPAISVYEKHGISHQLFGRRIGLGWDPLRAATQPPAGPTTKAAIALRKAAA